MKKIILLIEDSSDIRDLVARFLEMEDYRVWATVSASDAFTFLRAKFQAGETPDLILVDYMMPGQNGLEFLRESRKLPELAQTPAILVSASSQVAPPSTWAELGLKAVVPKPFEIDDLIALIASTLGT